MRRSTLPATDGINPLLTVDNYSDYISRDGMRPDVVSDDAEAAVERARHNPDNRTVDLGGTLSAQSIKEPQSETR